MQAKYEACDFFHKGAIYKKSIFYKKEEKKLFWLQHIFSSINHIAIA